MKWIELKVQTTMLGTELLTAIFYSECINGLRIDYDERAREALLETKSSWDYADGE